jgi:hypothetical protein
VEQLPAYVTNLGMGSLVETFKDGTPFTVVAYALKTVTNRKGESFPVLVLATEDGNLYATRSGGLLHRWQQMVEQGLPDSITLRLVAKEIVGDDYPPGATTWDFQAIWKKPSQS